MGLPLDEAKKISKDDVLEMRSGRGFLNDLRPTPDITAQIGQPTLIIATRTDRGVPFAHAQSYANAIQHAENVDSHAHSHFVWLGSDWPAIAERIRTFLDADARRLARRTIASNGLGRTGLDVPVSHDDEQDLDP